MLVSDFAGSLALGADELGADELPAADEELGALGVAELLPPLLELGLDGEGLDELGELGLVPLPPALPDIEPDDEPLRFAGSADEPDEDDDAESPGRSQP